MAPFSVGDIFIPMSHNKVELGWRNWYQVHADVFKLFPSVEWCMTFQNKKIAPVIWERCCKSFFFLRFTQFLIKIVLWTVDWLTWGEMGKNTIDHVCYSGKELVLLCFYICKMSNVFVSRQDALPNHKHEAKSLKCMKLCQNLLLVVHFFAWQINSLIWFYLSCSFYCRSSWKWYSHVGKLIYGCLWKNKICCLGWGKQDVWYWSVQF